MKRPPWLLSVIGIWLWDVEACSSLTSKGCSSCISSDTTKCLWTGTSCEDKCGEIAPCYNDAGFCSLRGKTDACSKAHSCIDCVDVGCFWNGHNCSTTCYDRESCLSGRFECAYADNNHGAHQNHPLPTVDMGFIFVLTSLAMGVFFHFLSKVIVTPPYTVSMFLLGASLQVFYLVLPSEGPMGQTLDYIRDLHPHVVLVPLLPPLIWESAFDVDWHVFKRVLPSCLMLAVPGVLLNLMGVSSVLMFMFPYNWAWMNALVLGIILAATDPVAVVATLQDLSAPPRLSTIIEGESLLNDGTAFVLFIIFVTMPDDPLTDQIAKGCQLALVAPIFGYIAARFFSLMISHIDNPLIEITISVVGFYGTFLFGEIMLGTSGVLSLVVFGVYFAYRGKFSFSIGTLHKAERVYEFLGFSANTIIFSLSGVVVFHVDDTNRHIISDPASWGLLIALYFICHAVRFLSILIMWPCLSRMGYGLAFKEIVMMTFSGLRGAIGLTLVLLIALYSKGIDRPDQKLIEFYVSGIVLLTLVVNGTFAPLVYRKLAIYPKDPHRPSLLKKAVSIVKTHCDNFETKVLREHWFFEDTCWSCVGKLTPNLDDCSVSGGKLHLKHDFPSLRKVFGDYHREKCLYERREERLSTGNLKALLVEEKNASEGAEDCDTHGISYDDEEFAWKPSNKITEKMKTQGLNHNLKVEEVNPDGNDGPESLDVIADEKIALNMSLHTDTQTEVKTKKRNLFQSIAKTFGGDQSVVMESTSLTLAYLSAVKAAYARDIENGMLSADAALVLAEANDRGSELWTLPGQQNATMADALEKEFEELELELEIGAKFKRLHCRDSIQRWWVFRDASVAMEAFTGYCMCHSSVADELLYHLQVNLEEACVIHFINKAKDRVLKLSKEYSDCAWITKACIAARLLCVNQTKKAEELYESGFLSLTDEEHLREMLYERIHDLNSFRSTWLLHAQMRHPGAARLKKALRSANAVKILKGNRGVISPKRRQVLPKSDEDDTPTNSADTARQRINKVEVV